MIETRLKYKWQLHSTLDIQPLCACSTLTIRVQETTEYRTYLCPEVFRRLLSSVSTLCVRKN